LLKKVAVSISLISYAFAQNIDYKVSHMHTLTLKQGEVDFHASLLKIDDKIDIFNIKEQELGSSSRYDAVGDLLGFNIGARYGITDSLMVSYSRTCQQIDYSSNKIYNHRDDLFLRYNLFQSPHSFFNSGISVDVGFEQNRLDDFYLNDLTTINNLIKKILPNKQAEIIHSDGITTVGDDPFPLQEGYYALFDGTTTQLKEKKPYIALVDTYDRSLYFRVLSGFYGSSYMTDFYAGYKRTKINNLVTTTDELIGLAKDAGLNLVKNLDRYEDTLFLGFNHSLAYAKYLFEFNYEFEKFFRDEGLDYIDYNHIINASISYLLTDKLSINIGGKFMYRQLNGQIPYLYNQYTQTSYDHKYGYAKLGVVYSF